MSTKNNDPRCSACRKPITLGSKSGLCQRCSRRAALVRAFSQGRKCTRCDRPISNRNESGLCQYCNKINSQVRANRLSRSLRFEHRKAFGVAGLPMRNCRFCKRPFQPASKYERLCSAECRWHENDSDKGWAYRSVGRLVLEARHR